MTDLATAPARNAAPTGPRHLTMTQALSAYDTSMREKATAANGPINRTTTVGMHLDGDLAAVVFVGADEGLRYLDMRADAVPERLTPAALTALVSDAYDLSDPAVGAHVPFVFADAETLRRTVKFADRLAKEKGTLATRNIARLLTYRATLPFSVYSPVLTEALASRYWLPGEADPDSPLAWDVAFSHSKPTTARGAFAYLIGRAVEGGFDKKIMKALAGAEKYGARSAQYGSSHSQCSAFTKAGTLTDAHAALLAVDPTLRERNILSGIITKIQVLDIGTDDVTASIDGEPGKVREGSRVLLFTDDVFDNKVEVTLRRLDFVGDELVAVLSTPAKNAKNAHLVEQAKRTDQPLYLATAPFLMVKRAPKNRRWTEGGEARDLPVDIPADIALAGAPIND